MANSGRKNDNGSQFFLTLGDTKELTGRNTMFGKIVGDTLYNLVRMGQGECEEGTERPVYPVKILGAEVVINPFEDMVPREIVKKTNTLEDAAVAARKKAAAKKKKGGKALLSFGGEEGDEPAIPTSKKPKFNTRLVVAAPLVRQTDTPAPQKPILTSVPPKSDPKPLPTKTPPIDTDTLPDAPEPPFKKPHPVRSSRSPSSSPEPPAKSSALAQTNAQIAALQASLRSRTTSGTAAPIPTPPKKSLLSLQKAMLPATSVLGRKRKRGKARAADDDDDAAAAALLRFQSKLSSAVYLPVPDAPSPGEQTAPKGTGNILDDDPEGNLCDLHFVPACASCGVYDRAERSQSPEAGDGLWAHTLSFEKDRRGKDLTWKKKNEELSVVDPREKEKEILGAKKERRKDDGRSAFRKGFGGAGGGGGGGSSGGREWDRRRDEAGPSGGSGGRGGSGSGSGSGSGRGGRR